MGRSPTARARRAAPRPPPSGRRAPGWLASTTCTSTSASVSSSSVARNAATSSCGSLRMKPTVSVRMNGGVRRARHQAGGRIERDEELVGRGAAGAGQTIEQGGLARVGVADEGDHRHAGAPAARRAAGGGASARAASSPRIFIDALADHAAVGLELGLARSPRADAAAQPLEVLPLPDQPRQQVRELRQLDLELALRGARALGEDVEDERGAVDHLDAERAARGCAPGWARAGRRRSKRLAPCVAATRRDLLDLAACRSRGRASARAGPGSPGPPRVAPADSARPASSSSDSSTSTPRAGSGSRSGGQHRLLACTVTRSASSRVHRARASRSSAAPSGARPPRPRRATRIVRLAREPRHLPLGVAHGVALHEPQRLARRSMPPRSDLRELPVADAVHRRQRGVVARRRADAGPRPSCHGATHAPARARPAARPSAGARRGARPIMTRRHGAIGRPPSPRLRYLASPAPAPRADLERADHAHLIVGMQAARDSGRAPRRAARAARRAPARPRTTRARPAGRDRRAAPASRPRSSART